MKTRLFVNEVLFRRRQNARFRTVVPRPTMWGEAAWLMMDVNQWRDVPFCDSFGNQRQELQPTTLHNFLFSSLFMCVNWFYFIFPSLSRIIFVVVNFISDTDFSSRTRLFEISRFWCSLFTVTISSFWCFHIFSPFCFYFVYSLACDLTLFSWFTP